MLTEPVHAFPFCAPCAGLSGPAGTLLFYRFGAARVTVRTELLPYERALLVRCPLCPASRRTSASPVFKARPG